MSGFCVCIGVCIDEYGTERSASGTLFTYIGLASGVWIQPCRMLVLGCHKSVLLCIWCFVGSYFLQLCTCRILDLLGIFDGKSVTCSQMSELDVDRVQSAILTDLFFNIFFRGRMCGNKATACWDGVLVLDQGIKEFFCSVG
jgi:hypothetical protein